MHTTLTTFDGYPRDDLDIAQSAYFPFLNQGHGMPTSLQYEIQEHA